jgi:hypothetical protein
MDEQELEYNDKINGGFIDLTDLADEVKSEINKMESELYTTYTECDHSELAIEDYESVFDKIEYAMMCLEDTASAIRKEVDKLRDAITNKN